ncbi:MAG: C4-type zinc ribbon domain-containing protein [Thermodesulfobacteriota bacterium]
MLPELSLLIDLQELDKEILEVTQSLGQLPEELQAQTRELAAQQGEQEAQLQELENLKGKRRDKEGEMADLEKGIKTSRSRLMEIKNNIEYRAMLKEIAFKEDQRDQMETKVLEIMEQIEAKNQHLAALKTRLEEQRQAFGQRQKEIEAQLKELKKRAADLEKKREVLRQRVPEALLKRYEFVRQRRNSTTIAEVRQGVCLGCHMNILPQQFIDLQKGEEILQCPHCQRILYWLGEEEEAETASLSQKVS